MKILYLIIIILFFTNSVAIDLDLTKEEKQYLAKKQHLSVLSLENFHPFSFRQNDIPMGYSVDVMKFMLSEINKEIKFIKKPWNEQLEMLKSGDLDIIPHFAITEDRKKFAEYTDFMHLTFLIGFALNTNEEINSIKDLEGKTLALVEGYYLHEHFKKKFPNIKLLPLKSTQEAIEAVAKGKAFAVVDNIPTLNYFIQEKWLINLKILSVDDIGLPLNTQIPMGVTKGNIHLKSILEKVYISLDQNELNKIKQKWINVNQNKKESILLNPKETLYLKKKEKIKMCVLTTWLPFEQLDENTNHKGVGADIINIVSKRLNKEFVLVPTKEWAESLQNIRDRKCDILPVAMNLPSRRDAMNFTKPYLKEPFVIATTNDKFYIRDIEGLSNKKIGIVKSYAIVEVLKTQNPLIQIVPVKNTKEGLEKVSNGEIYGYVDTMPAIGYFIQKFGFFDLKIAGKLSSTIDLSIASRNDEPLLNDIMQKALNTISEEEIRKIIGRWIEIKVQQEFDYQKLFYIIFIFLIIVLIILYKNRSINKVNKKLAKINGQLQKANQEVLEQQNMVDKHVMILSTDLKGKIINVNSAYCKRIGYSKDELIGKQHTIIQHPDMSSKVFKNSTWSGEIKNLTKLNETVYFQVVIEALIKDNKKIGYRSISEDITNKKRIEELSITDKLTSLYNRLKLDEIIDEQISLVTRYNTSFSVILLDIDNFKSVNDTYGHDVGDIVLQEIAKNIKRHTRKTDFVGRWGGEEFLIICQNTNLNHAYTVAENVRKSINSIAFEECGKQTVSLGVTEYSNIDSLKTLFKRVDKCLYEAKKSGKNQTKQL